MKHIFLVLLMLLPSAACFGAKKNNACVARLDSAIVSVSNSLGCLPAQYDGKAVGEVLEKFRALRGDVLDCDNSEVSVAAYARIDTLQQQLALYLNNICADLSTQCRNLENDLRNAVPWRDFYESTEWFLTMKLPEESEVSNWPAAPRDRYVLLCAAQNFNSKMEVMRKWFKRALEDNAVDVNTPEDRLTDEQRNAIGNYLNENASAVAAYNACSKARNNLNNKIENAALDSGLNKRPALRPDEKACIDKMIDELKLFNKFF